MSPDSPVSKVNRIFCGGVIDVGVLSIGSIHNNNNDYFRDDNYPSDPANYPTLIGLWPQKYLTFGSDTDYSNILNNWDSTSYKSDGSSYPVGRTIWNILTNNLSVSHKFSMPGALDINGSYVGGPKSTDSHTFNTIPSIIPANGLMEIGSSTQKINKIYANQFIGDLVSTGYGFAVGPSTDTTNLYLVESIYGAQVAIYNMSGLGTNGWMLEGMRIGDLIFIRGSINFTANKMGVMFNLSKIVQQNSANPLSILATTSGDVAKAFIGRPFGYGMMVNYSGVPIISKYYSNLAGDSANSYLYNTTLQAKFSSTIPLTINNNNDKMLYVGSSTITPINFAGEISFNIVVQTAF